MPAAVLLATTAPLGIAKPVLAAPAVAAVGYIAGLVLTDAVLAGRDTALPERSVSCRLQIAAHRVLRPLAFRWGHLTEQRRQRLSRGSAGRSVASAPTPSGAVTR
jgi:hypothetical protein